MFLETKKQGESQFQLEEWQQDLLIAADFLEHNEWIRGKCHAKLADGRDGYCLVGAIWWSFGVTFLKNLDDSHPRYETIMNKMETFFNRNPSAWNDHKAQSKDEVVQVMRRVANGSS